MLADINGALIGFDDIGNGAPILFIHAGIADRSMWDFQVSQFSKAHRVIRLDLRGFGESNLPALAFSNHEDARALLDRLGIEQATVVGISMGGEVALDLALAHPNRVLRLVLVSTLAAMQVPTVDLKANWAGAETAFKRGDIDRATEIEVEGWIIGAGRSTDDVEESYRVKATEMIAAIWNRALLHPAGVEELEIDPPKGGGLDEIGIPTLLIRGDHDFPDVPASMDRLRAGIAGSKLLVIPNSAHLPPLERHAEFNSILSAFLAES